MTELSRKHARIALTLSLLLAVGCRTVYYAAWEKLGREKRHLLKYGLITGPGAVGTYLLVLFALTLAKVSYIVPTRQISTLFGAAAGYILFKEKFTWRRGVAVLLIAAGAVCIKMG